MKIDTVKLECMLNHFLAAVQEVYEEALRMFSMR